MLCLHTLCPNESEFLFFTGLLAQFTNVRMYAGAVIIVNRDEGDVECVCIILDSASYMCPLLQPRLSAWASMAWPHSSQEIAICASANGEE